MTARRSGTRQGTTATQPMSIDEYLAGVDPVQRRALERLRRAIKRIVPRAQECISYRMPAFRVDGKVQVWFAAAARHCAFYPGGSVGEFAAELTAFDLSKGTVRFQPDRPIPLRTLRLLVRARMARTLARRPPARRSTTPARARR